MHDLTTTLRERQDEFVGRDNPPIAEDRDNLVAALSAQFTKTAASALREGALPAGGQGR